MKIPMKLADSEEMLTFKTSFKFPQVNVGGTTDHSKLENLDYAHSGHTGFASSEDIPTKVSQLENDKGYIDNSVSNLVNYELKGKTGTNLGVSIDNTTYVMTIDLKNTAGDVLSTGSVDLPLESMVIGASYDDSTKEIVLTLQSGEEVRFSVSDLVSGLVSQSTFDTKMNEISQEFNHKFDMPYYYEYNGDTDFEDTSETTLAMFNEIKELMEAGQKPCIIVKKGATGANSYITYHFIVPQFGSLDTTYIMLKGSPVRKDGNTFNLVALNCEKDTETNQIKRVYEKKADGSITFSGDNVYVFKYGETTTPEILEKFNNAYNSLRNNEQCEVYLIGTNSRVLRSTGCSTTSYKHIFFADQHQISASKVLDYYTYSASFAYIELAQNSSALSYINIPYYISENKRGFVAYNNTAEYTPTGDYNPATKKYVDNKLTTIQGYDATKTQTLKNINGVLTWQTDGE